MRQVLRRSRTPLALAALALGGAVLAGPAPSVALTPAGWFQNLPGDVRGSAAVTATTAAANPCGTLPAPAAGTQPITHVVWVVFESKTYTMVHNAETKLDSTTGTTYAPYLAQLTADCGHSTGYQATPSAGAKLEMTSGQAWGVTSDAQVEPGPDLYSQLGTNWRQYMGGMTANCTQHENDVYYARHNIATFYTDADAACATQDVPLPTDPTQIDLSAGFTWIEGDVPDSMHLCNPVTTDCPLANTMEQIRTGDLWASNVIPALTASPEYQSGSTAIFVVWDQGTKGDSNTPFLVISPYTTPGSQSSVVVDHDSLLRTTEELLGLPPLAGAATATTIAGQLGLPPLGSTHPSSSILPPVITTVP